jgi:hypothetical protein
LDKADRHLRNDGGPPRVCDIPDSDVHQELSKWAVLASLIVHDIYPRVEEGQALRNTCIFVPLDEAVHDDVLVVRI